MKKSLCLIISATLICCTNIFSGKVCAEEQSSIRCTVIESMRPRIQSISTTFMEENPGAKIDLNSVQSVDQAFERLLNKDADVITASRKMSKTERERAGKQGLRTVETLIGYGGIVFLTHSSNPVKALTVEQARDILKGKYTNWRDLGGPDQPIILFRPDITHPGTLIFMQEEFLGGEPTSDKSLSLNTFPEIIREVSKTTGAIGYVRIRDVFEMKRSPSETIKILPIRKDVNSRAVLPLRENVANNSYVLKRSYYLYSLENAEKPTKKFIKFVVDKGWGPQQ